MYTVLQDGGLVNPSSISITVTTSSVLVVIVSRLARRCLEAVVNGREMLRVKGGVSGRSIMYGTIDKCFVHDKTASVPSSIQLL